MLFTKINKGTLRKQELLEMKTKVEEFIFDRGAAYNAVEILQKTVQK